MSVGNFTGRLKNYDPIKGYGFVECSDLKARGYNDAFLHKAQVGNAMVGDEVGFACFLNSRGMPQAENVYIVKKAPDSDRASSSSAIPGVRGQVIGNYTGKIKRFNIEKGYGFIECMQLKTEGYNNDVYLHRLQVGTFAVGDVVKFQACLNDKGQPQARDVTLIQAATEEDKVKHAEYMATLAAGGGEFMGQQIDAAEGQELGTFAGTIKSFNSQSGYGFIDCPDLRAMGYVSDIFLHHYQLNGCQVGDAVCFMAYVGSKGQLRGKDIQALGPGGAAMAASAALMMNYQAAQQAAVQTLEHQAVMQQAAAAAQAAMLEASGGMIGGVAIAASTPAAPLPIQDKAESSGGASASDGGVEAPGGAAASAVQGGTAAAQGQMQAAYGMPAQAFMQGGAVPSGMGVGSLGAFGTPASMVGFGLPGAPVPSFLQAYDPSQIAALQQLAALAPPQPLQQQEQQPQQQQEQQKPPPQSQEQKQHHHDEQQQKHQHQHQQPEQQQEQQQQPHQASQPPSGALQLSALNQPAVASSAPPQQPQQSHQQLQQQHQQQQQREQQQLWMMQQQQQHQQLQHQQQPPPQQHHQQQQGFPLLPAGFPANGLPAPGVVPSHGAQASVLSMLNSPGGYDAEASAVKRLKMTESSIMSL